METEASVPNDNGSFYIVDVLATNDKETIALEVGNVTEAKEAFLKKTFTTYKNIPYTIITDDGYVIHTYCGYKWQSRTKTPKACPRCKGRLDKFKL